jgi:hypothetical protein
LLKNLRDGRFLQFPITLNKSNNLQNKSRFCLFTLSLFDKDNYFNSEINYVKKCGNLLVLLEGEERGGGNGREKVGFRVKVSNEKTQGHKRMLWFWS